MRNCLSRMPEPFLNTSKQFSAYHTLTSVNTEFTFFFIFSLISLTFWQVNTSNKIETVAISRMFL